MRPYLLSTPAALLLVGLLVCPLGLLARISLCEPGRGSGFYTPGTWTLANYTAVTDAYGLRLLLYTIAFALASAALTLLLAYPLALFVRSLGGVWRWLAMGCILLPKFASVLVILFGLQQILGDSGPVNQLLLATGIIAEPIRLVRGPIGAVIGESFLILPYAVLVLFVQLLRIDPALMSAARGLGASSWQAFARVTLPLSLPGLIVSGQLALIWGMGAFLGPLILGSPNETTLSVELHQQAFEYGRWPRAAALAVLLASAVGVCLLASSLLTRGRKHT